MARRIALGAVLGVLLVAAPARATVVPELGAVTTVHANGPSWIPVQLKQPVRLDYSVGNGGAEAKVTGSGRVRGFALRLDADGPDQPGVGGFTYSDDPRPPVAFLGDISHVDFQTPHFYYDLPAGVYRLHVLADGPATLELSLPGPGPGPDITLTTDQRSAYKATEMPRLDTFPTTNMAVWGAGVTLETFGLIDAELDIDGLDVFDRREICTYKPGHDFSGSDAFTRGCPGADDPDADPLYPGEPPMGEYAIGTFQPNAAPGRYGIGGNLLLAGSPPTVFASVEALSYGTPGLPRGYELNPPNSPKKNGAKKRCTAKRKRAHKCRANRKRKR
jgi:hypothetical protein